MKKFLAICSIFFTVCATFTACGDNNDGHYTDDGNGMITQDERTTAERYDSTTTAGRDNDTGDWAKDAVDGVGDAGKDVIGGAADAGKDIIDGAEDAVDDVIDGLDGDEDRDGDRDNDKTPATTDR